MTGVGDILGGLGGPIRAAVPRHWTRIRTAIDRAVAQCANPADLPGRVAELMEALEEGVPHSLFDQDQIDVGSSGWVRDDGAGGTVEVARAYASFSGQTWIEDWVVEDDELDNFLKPSALATLKDYGDYDSTFAGAEGDIQAANAKGRSLWRTTWVSSYTDPPTKELVEAKLPTTAAPITGRAYRMFEGSRVVGHMFRNYDWTDGEPRGGDAWLLRADYKAPKAGNTVTIDFERETDLRTFLMDLITKTDTSVDPLDKYMATTWRMKKYKP